jgi:hypothetical protein
MQEFLEKLQKMLLADESFVISAERNIRTESLVVETTDGNVFLLDVRKMWP